jgi:hypothetical protein
MFLSSYVLVLTRMMFSREYWFNSFPFLVASCNLNIRRLSNREEMVE